MHLTSFLPANEQAPLMLAIIAQHDQQRAAANRLFSSRPVPAINTGKQEVGKEAITDFAEQVANELNTAKSLLVAAPIKTYQTQHQQVSFFHSHQTTAKYIEDLLSGSKDSNLNDNQKILLLYLVYVNFIKHKASSDLVKQIEQSLANLLNISAEYSSALQQRHSAAEPTITKVADPVFQLIDKAAEKKLPDYAIDSNSDAINERLDSIVKISSSFKYKVFSQKTRGSMDKQIRAHWRAIALVISGSDLKPYMKPHKAMH